MVSDHRPYCSNDVYVGITLQLQMELEEVFANPPGCSVNGELAGLGQ